MAPNSNTPKSELPPSARSTSSATRRKHQRIPRACDRCRMKKAKCDGRHQCNQCAAHDSPCTYTHRKHHPATNYYLQMLNLSNEAIRRMYIACKDNQCFPGEPPTDEHDRNVSVHAILQGLGLLTDGMLPFDTPISPKNQSISRPRSQSHASGRLPRANSGSSNQSIDTASLHKLSGFTSNHSTNSSISHHSLEDLAVSPTTQTHSFDLGPPNHQGAPSMLPNLDLLSFGPPDGTMPMASLASTNTHAIEPLRNDFLFPWPGAFADSTDYLQQQQ